MASKFLNIDKDRFEKLCLDLQDQGDICKELGCSRSGLGEWCKRIYGKTYHEVFKDICAANHRVVKRGRTVLIDQAEFEKLCEIQCTQEEIACFFSCSVDSVNTWCKRVYGRKFAEVFVEKRGAGRVSIRRSQFRLAEFNPTMSIWLGKQYLSQTDKQEVAVAVNDDDTIKRMGEYFENKRKGNP